MSWFEARENKNLFTKALIAFNVVLEKSLQFLKNIFITQKGIYTKENHKT